MKAIHRYQEGHGPEAGVWLERRLAVLCQKKHQPDFFGISPGQKLTISWFPSGLHTLYSTQHILQVRDKNLENACAKASPQSLLQSTSGKERHHFGFTLKLRLFHGSPPLIWPKTLLFCCSKKTQSLAFPYISTMLSWQAGDASR